MGLPAPRLLRITPGPVPSTVRVGDEVRFSITVSDPSGGLVSLRLMNPQAGLVFDPILDATSPATTEVRWRITRLNLGWQELVFEANDGASPPHRARLPVHLRIGWGAIGRTAVLTGDVTGDGKLDVVARARAADIGGVVDTGALYVWSGATTPTGAPTASLRVPGASASDFLGENGLQLADITGDGVLDVVAASDDADPGGVSGAGAIYLFAGGVGLSGIVPPTATMAGALAGDALGSTGFHVGDVTNDGILDVVAGVPLANIGGVSNSGAVLVWAGGPALTGTPPPLATLSAPGAVANDQLGENTWSELLLLEDVTGDGAADVIAGSTLADVGGVADAGGLWVWAGGPGLTGTPLPTASLAVSSAVAFTGLGYTPDHQGLRLGDVTGDGLVDLVVAASKATVGGVLSTGAIYVWAGGPGLVGALNESAALTVPGAASGDQLPYVLSGAVGGGAGLILRDVSGDGTLDVVALTYRADVGGVVDAGAAYVWAGGPGLSGPVAPTATLTVPGAVANDGLGGADHGMQIHDVTGDGILDVVTCSPDADVGGVTNTGAIHVFAGGGGMVGSMGPTAALTVPGASASQRMGGTSGWSFQVEDLTGDGVADIVTAAPNATVGGVVQAGALYVFSGGAGLTGAVGPSATLTVPGAAAADFLGDGLSGLGLILADTSDDGILDIVAPCYSASVGGVNDTGAVYVFNGGVGLTGAVGPSASLTVPGAQAGQEICKANEEGLFVADITGDGVLDIVAGSPDRADGATDSGAIYLWYGGAGLSGAVAPNASLRETPAGNIYQIGNEIVLADVTGDGMLDFIDDAEGYDFGGTLNVGAVYVFAGGPISGSVTQSGLMRVTGAVANDRLGD